MGSTVWLVDVAFELRLGTPGPSSLCRGQSSNSEPSPSSRTSSSFACTSSCRLLPRLPAFPLDQLLQCDPGLLAPMPAHSQTDVPCQIQLHNQIRHDFGHGVLPAPPAPRTPTCPCSPARRRRRPPLQDSPYLGDFSAVTWNCQALFASDAGRHRTKSYNVRRLMADHDIGLWTETHGTAGGNAVWRNPSDCTSWWAPGLTAGSAGVGVTIQNKFLSKFSARPRWHILLPGRVAVLRLRGAEGCLDIIV
eukprot:7086152-Pyramimonas_sp.AAC.2